LREGLTEEVEEAAHVERFERAHRREAPPIKRPISLHNRLAHKVADTAEPACRDDVGPKCRPLNPCEDASQLAAQNTH